MAIDNAAFDLMAIRQSKFGIAFREYWAKNLLSRSGAEQGCIQQPCLLSVYQARLGDEYKQILEAVAQFSEQGLLRGRGLPVMDRVTEAQLMALPEDQGCCRWLRHRERTLLAIATPSHFVNTELNASGKSVAGRVAATSKSATTSGSQAQQHGDVPLTIDATSGCQQEEHHRLSPINTSILDDLTSPSTSTVQAALRHSLATL